MSNVKRESYNLVKIKMKLQHVSDIHLAGFFHIEKITQSKIKHNIFIDDFVYRKPRL